MVGWNEDLTFEVLHFILLTVIWESLEFLSYSLESVYSQVFNER